MSHSNTELLSDLSHCCQLAISELELKPKVWLRAYGLVTSTFLDITTYCMKVTVKEGSWSEIKATRADFTTWRKGLELPSVVRILPCWQNTITKDLWEELCFRTINQREIKGEVREEAFEQPGQEKPQLEADLRQ